MNNARGRVITNEHGKRMHAVRVEFDQAGWRRFAMLNRILGVRFIKGVILKHELAEYIAAHEERGVHLDATCQEVRYDDGVYLIMSKRCGVWYITDIWSSEAPDVFLPVLFWKRIKRGWRELAEQVLIGWRSISFSAREGGVLYR